MYEVLLLQSVYSVSHRCYHYFTQHFFPTPNEKCPVDAEPGSPLSRQGRDAFEYQRNSISSEVDERTLREIYLAPFQMAIQEGKPWAIMASYNKINGIFADENPFTLTDVLRGEWNFEGLAMSDWFGTQSTSAAVNAGLDLEMPGPANWRGARLLKAVEEGEVAEATIYTNVLRLLHLIERTGVFEHPQTEPEQAIDRPEHRAASISGTPCSR